MNHPKERNEFGLDEDNALDVQKERFKSAMPYITVVAALLAAFALTMFILPNTPNNNATHVPPASTSGAGTSR
jgi:hypothetical protein